MGKSHNYHGSDHSPISQRSYSYRTDRSRDAVRRIASGCDVVPYRHFPAPPHVDQFQSPASQERQSHVRWQGDPTEESKIQEVLKRMEKIKSAQPGSATTEPEGQGSHSTVRERTSWNQRLPSRERSSTGRSGTRVSFPDVSTHDSETRKQNTPNEQSSTKKGKAKTHMETGAYRRRHAPAASNSNVGSSSRVKWANTDLEEEQIRIVQDIAVHEHEVERLLRDLEEIRVFEREGDWELAGWMRPKDLESEKSQNIDATWLKRIIASTIREEMQAHETRRRKASSSSSSFTSDTSAGTYSVTHKYPKKGKTRVPRRLVSKRALIDLGYPFIEEVRPNINLVEIKRDDEGRYIKLISLREIPSSYPKH